MSNFSSMKCNMIGCNSHRIIPEFNISSIHLGCQLNIAFTILALMCIPITAQQRVVTTGIQSDTTAFMSFSKFQKATKYSGYLVVMEKGNEGTIWKAMIPILVSDDCFAYGIQRAKLDPEEEGMVKELREREHWDATPRWLLFDTSGRIARSSTDAPRLNDVLQAFQEAGLKPMKQRLEEFLKEHPDRQDALMELCRWEGTIASRRLRPLLSPKKQGEETNLPTLLASKGPGANASQVGVDLLEAPEDFRIFGDYANILDRVMNSDAWMISDARLMPAALPAGGRLSPLLKQKARQYILKIEEALRRQPNLRDAWRVWIQLCDWADLSEPESFIESIQPLPGDGDFPPDSVTSILVLSLRQRGDWAGLLKLLLPIWERWKETRIDILQGGDLAKLAALEGPWTVVVRPILEAYLRQGEFSKAQAFLEQVHGWIGTPAFARQAAELANACNQQWLAERWNSIAAAKP